MNPQYRFQECPKCHGYGVRDSGTNCTYCGGHGHGGLNSAGNSAIGSGEIIIDTHTGQRITHAEFAKRMTARG